MTTPLIKDEAIITALDHEGRGIAYQDERTIFIDNALIGEKVRFKIFKKKKKLFFAKSLEIINPSPKREEPICEFFGMCGGCSMQHFDISSQLAHKQRAFEQTLQHVGKVFPDQVLSPVSGPTSEYRHKARFRVKYVEKKQKVLIGFNEKLSHFLTDMDSCKVIPLKISSLLSPMQALFTSLSIRDQIPQIEYASNQERHILVLRILEALSENDINLLKDFQKKKGIEFWTQTKGYESVKPLLSSMQKSIVYKNKEFNLSFEFKPTSFTQINPFINAVLIRRVMNFLNPKPTEVIFDFFCGLGNFTLPIASYGSNVVGFESDEALVESANINAEKNKLQKLAEFKRVDLFKVDDQAITSLGRASKWLIDPPRDGALNLINSITEENKPNLICYVSCNPATLARDAHVLTNEKGYKFAKAGILNMFPHTSHVESIALFEINEQ